MIISRIVHCLTYESIALACRSRCFMMFFCFEIRLIRVLTIFASKLNPLSQGINILDQGNVAGSSRKTTPQELDELEPWGSIRYPLKSPTKLTWIIQRRDFRATRNTLYGPVRRKFSHLLFLRGIGRAGVLSDANDPIRWHLF